MYTVVKIICIGLFLFGLSTSSKESSFSEESGANYTEVSNSLAYKKMDSNTVLYFDNKKNYSNRLYIPINSLDTEHVFVLYNTLSSFTHTDNDEVVIKEKDYKFVVHGYYQVDSNSKVYFTVTMLENKANLIQNKIRAEFSKNNSIINKDYYYTISPGIFLDFEYMSYIPSYVKIFIITSQEYHRIQYYGPYISLSYFCILLVSTIITIPGGILICAFILKYKHLQTPPNVYVFNLALTDILLLTMQIYVMVPAIFIKRDNQSIDLWLIKIYFIQCFWKVVCWTAVGITVDRYITICHPFLGNRISTYRRAVKINVIIWACSSIATLIEVLLTKIYLNVKDIPDLDTRYIYLDIYSLTVLVVLPMCIILPSYICITLRLWKLSKMSTNEQPLTSNSIKVAVIIAVQFIFCWAPAAGCDLLLKIISPIRYEWVYVLIESLVLDLFLLGSMLNPILFALVSVHFRKAFKDLGLFCIGSMRRRLCCSKSAHVDSNIALNEY